jgi:hypothetical protein
LISHNLGNPTLAKYTPPDCKGKSQLEKGSLLVWQFRIAYGLAAGLFEVRMSPILLMILVYFLSALVFVGVLVFFMKIDPKHEEVAKDAYKKRLQEELKRLG